MLFEKLGGKGRVNMLFNDGQFSSAGINKRESKGVTERGEEGNRGWRR